MAATSTTAAAATTRSQPPKPGIKIPPIPPNQTLYVMNLPSSKINKADLKTALYMLFSTYGPVLDVVALKTLKMRGQAHIVFRDVQAATQAIRSLEGFQFLGEELHIEYAKSKSHMIAKLDGTYKLPGSAAATNIEMTEAQQSIFNAPAPGTSTAAPGATPSLPVTTAHNGLSTNPTQNSGRVVADAKSPDTRGQKRPRDEEEEEDDDDHDDESDEDVAMEEDSDDE
ncbi:RNA-binding domain-containing protein [Hypoxylon sp. NC1633]|nr:RNA-binding domain-containing protein [Hypoxylon sp. NC1633]